MNEAVVWLTIFILSVFVGIEVISKVSSTLHTPLMSGANAIHGVILLGAIIVTGNTDNNVALVVGLIAIVLAAVNMVGGFVVTDRICSIRSVTTKPPTMFTAASTIAISPTTSAMPLSVVAGDQDRAEQDDPVDGVGAGHQRRVQGRGDLGDHLDAHEHAEHEDGQPGDGLVHCFGPLPRVGSLDRCGSARAGSRRRG